MKVTLKKITVTTIISFVIYVSLMLMVFSCRTVKKDWLEENYAKKTELTDLRETVLYSQKTMETKITESLILDITEKLKQRTQKRTESENENTTIKGSITAEDGKEKSATVGNTTIKSNGANLTFETTTSKVLTKEIESRYMEQNKKIDSQNILIKTQNDRLNTLETKLANLTSNQEIAKNNSAKSVKKNGLTFGFVFIIILTLVVLGCFYYFRKTIFGWFKRL